MTDTEFNYLCKKHTYIQERVHNITDDINNITDIEDYITKSNIQENKKYIYFINIIKLSNLTKTAILELKQINNLPDCPILLISNGSCDIADIINDESYICDLHDFYESYGNYQDI